MVSCHRRLALACITYHAIAFHDDAVELLANAYLLDVAVHSYESYQGCSKQVLVACWERVNMIGAIRSLSLSLSIATCIMWWEALQALKSYSFGRELTAVLCCFNLLSPALCGSDNDNDIVQRFRLTSTEVGGRMRMGLIFGVDGVLVPVDCRV